MPAADHTMRYAEAGLRLRALRLGRKFTLDGLAERVGTSRHHLIRLEKGMHRPRGAMVAALADALGEDIESFYAVESVEDDDDIEAVLLTFVRMVAGEHAHRAALEIAGR